MAFWVICVLIWLLFLPYWSSFASYRWSRGSLEALRDPSERREAKKDDFLSRSMEVLISQSLSAERAARWAKIRPCGRKWPGRSQNRKWQETLRLLLSREIKGQFVYVYLKDTKKSFQSLQSAGPRHNDGSRPHRTTQNHTGFLKCWSTAADQNENQARKSNFLTNWTSFFILCLFFASVVKTWDPPDLSMKGN